jgi:hypothetical protein
VDSGFGDDISVEAVAQIDGVNVVTIFNILVQGKSVSNGHDIEKCVFTHHSKSLYMMVKNT